MKFLLIALVATTLAKSLYDDGEKRTCWEEQPYGSYLCICNTGFEVPLQGFYQSKMGQVSSKQWFNTTGTLSASSSQTNSGMYLLSWSVNWGRVDVITAWTGRWNFYDDTVFATYTMSTDKDWWIANHIGQSVYKRVTIANNPCGPL